MTSLAFIICVRLLLVSHVVTLIMIHYFSSPGLFLILVACCAIFIFIVGRLMIILYVPFFDAIVTVI